MFAGRIWNGDILVVDIEELENLDASEIQRRRLSAKEVITPRRSEHFTGRSRCYVGCRVEFFIINGPSRWGLLYKWTCAFTREHPGTRRCTIHPRTTTTTLTQDTSNHCISVTFGSASQVFVLSFTIDEPISSESLAASEHRSEEAVD